MRLIPLLLLATALVMAGCAKKSDTGDNGGTTTPPTTSTTPGGTTTSSPPSTTPSTTPTTPTDNNSTGGGGTTPMTPKVLKQGSVSWPDQCATPTSTAGGAGAPTPTCPSIAFTVDPGYTTLNLTVAWDCPQSAPACPGAAPTGGPTIAVGSLSCVMSAAPAQPPIAKCTKTGSAASGKIVASGDGTIVGTYTLTEM
jgi:hypothetical protein